MDNILINPRSGNEYTNVPLNVAAEYLGVGRSFLGSALKKSIIPIGVAVPPQSEGGKWKFCIPVERLKAYKNASDLKVDSVLAKLEGLKTSA